MMMMVRCEDCSEGEAVKSTTCVVARKERSCQEEEEEHDDSSLPHHPLAMSFATSSQPSAFFQAAAIAAMGDSQSIAHLWLPRRKRPGKSELTSQPSASSEACESEHGREGLRALLLSVTASDFRAT